MTADSRSVLEARRDRECRLSADHALRSLGEAREFVRDRGLLTRTTDSALPSLFAACHEGPSHPEKGGFGQWPRTKWIWSFQLTSAQGVLVTKLHRGKTLYIDAAATGVFDPFCRRAIAAATGDDARLLEHLDRHGPSLPADLELELGWDKVRLRRVRNRLEKAGALVSDGLVFEDVDNWQFAPLRRWDEAVLQASRAENEWAELVLAGLRAAVIAPEAEIARWFSWSPPRGLLDRLVAEGQALRPAPGWLALPSNA